MNVRRRDGGVSDRDAQLMQVRHDITGGIQTFDRGPLMAIDLQAADVVARRAKCEREV